MKVLTGTHKTRRRNRLQGERLTFSRLSTPVTASASIITGISIVLTTTVARTCSVVGFLEVVPLMIARWLEHTSIRAPQYEDRSDRLSRPAGHECRWWRLLALSFGSKILVMDEPTAPLTTTKPVAV